MPTTERTPIPSHLQQTAASGPRATEKQTKFIRDLLESRDLTKSTKFMDATRVMDEGELRAYMQLLHGRAATVTKKGASEWIAALLELPRKTTVGSQAGPDVPAPPPGRYAIRDGDGVVKFYRVQEGRGKWQGRIFLSAGAGGPHGDPHWHPIPANRPQTHETYKAVMAELLKDPQAAAQLYGQEIGACGVCGRSLTDETSRAYGIGPICRAERGW